MLLGGRQNLKVFIFSRKLILWEKECFKAAREYCQCGDEEKTLRLLNLRFGRQGIVHFTVVCLVAKPLNRNEAKGDLVMIQTLLLFKCKLLCYHANKILVSNTTRSPSASLQNKGLATKYITVKWPII